MGIGSFGHCCSFLAEMIRFAQIIVTYVDKMNDDVKLTRYWFKVVTSIPLFLIGVQVLVWSKKANSEHVHVVKSLAKSLVKGIKCEQQRHKVLSQLNIEISMTT